MLIQKSSPAITGLTNNNNAKGKREHLPPVRWLLGRQLMGGLKGILLYATFGKKLDPRDWMRASVFPARERQTALLKWRELYEEQALAQGRPPTTAPDAATFWCEQKEFWFDYLADAGDGTRAMYSVAYLCMSNLWVQALAENELPSVDDARKVEYGKHDAYTMELPRGQFLFVGGDTAYHVADYMTLATRIQKPFEWAYQDLHRNGRIRADEPPRPLFGIPGNHDYYDQLDGFRRQFHKPLKPEPPPSGVDFESSRQICTIGYCRIPTRTVGKLRCAASSVRLLVMGP